MIDTPPSQKTSIQEANYLSQWRQIQLAWNNERMPQGMLLVGSFDSALFHFIQRVSQLIFCQKKEGAPCGECNDCRMVLGAGHPDLMWVKPEKSGGPIKIDQIRALHEDAYLTPQRTSHRLIVIESAERMNHSAANALLKILEEPAEHTLFLLVAQQLSTILPTVVSRCHIFHGTPATDVFTRNLLELGDHYPENSELKSLVKHAEFILEGLIAVIQGTAHPCYVTSQWSEFELNGLLWFLYLVYAQIQKMQIMGSQDNGPAIQQLNSLATLIDPIVIFDQIDKINAIRRKLVHNINVNQTLAVEDLLLALLP